MKTPRVESKQEARNRQEVDKQVQELRESVRELYEIFERHGLVGGRN